MTITRSDIIRVYEQQKGLSAYLNIPMDMTCKDILQSVSVDRIDNERGYLPDNIQLVTRFENMGRRSAN